MCEILLMTVTVIKIRGLPCATPVSMRWRWSCCSLWRRSWYWWGYPGGCGGQGSSHRGHGATPSDGSRHWCLEIYVRGSMPWLLNSVRCTWNLIWQHGHSKCSQDIGPTYFPQMEIWCLEYPGLLCPTRALWTTHSACTRYINLHFAWSNHLYSDVFLEESFFLEN